jgi:hypothetical protein
LGAERELLGSAAHITLPSRRSRARPRTISDCASIFRVTLPRCAFTVIRIVRSPPPRRDLPSAQASQPWWSCQGNACRRRPSLYAAIIVGLATIILIPVSVSLTATVFPVFVSPEVREREPVRHLHSVLVLRGNGLPPKRASTTATAAPAADVARTLHGSKTGT